MTKIKGITFDLWDTLVYDNSDEPKRQALGLQSKHDERRDLLWKALNTEDNISKEDATLAYNVSEAAFNNAWKKHSITWSVEERIDIILHAIGKNMPESIKGQLIRDLGEMEVNIPPDFIEGVHDALDILTTNYKLAIVSDAIVTPGLGLREVLRKNELLNFFSGFAFSDEVGYSKPHASMFESAAAQLGISVNEMIHIGDRDHNDIKGPQAIGMKAILFTASRDVDKGSSSADAICERFDDLPKIIERLI